MIGVRVDGFRPGSAARLFVVDPVGFAAGSPVAETVAADDTSVTFRGGVQRGQRFAVRGTSVDGAGKQVYATVVLVPDPPKTARKASPKPAAAKKTPAKAKATKATRKPRKAAKKGK